MACQEVDDLRFTDLICIKTLYWKRDNDLLFEESRKTAKSEP